MNTDTYKEKLLAEKTRLEKELGTVATKNQTSQTNWEGKEPDLNVDRADEGEVALVAEGIETNIAITNTLKNRLAEVENALFKIHSRIYGMCEVCGTHIEEDRLNANPAAKTCKAHM